MDRCYAGQTSIRGRFVTHGASFPMIRISHSVSSFFIVIIKGYQERGRGGGGGRSGCGDYGGGGRDSGRGSGGRGRGPGRGGPGRGPPKNINQVLTNIIPAKISEKFAFYLYSVDCTDKDNKMIDSRSRRLELFGSGLWDTLLVVRATTVTRHSKCCFLLTT